MNMSPSRFIHTERLVLKPISVMDADFILELVNTKAWLTFIGNKNISTPQDAIAYIQKIIANTTTNYWVVTLKDTQLPIGLITVIKRDYLEHRDIGFAFLPNHFNKGYAYEATSSVLDYLIKQHALRTIVAITIPENTRSIKLLQKLGLRFNKEIPLDNEVLQVYEASVNDLFLSNS